MRKFLLLAVVVFVCLLTTWAQEPFLEVEQEPSAPW